MSMLCICASHSPLMLVDMPDSAPGRQKRFESALAARAQAVAEYDPELVVVFGPDHFNGLFYDLMPAFCIGTAAHGTRDWGIAEGPLDVPRELALACIEAVRAADIDVALSHRMKVDHGLTIPLYKLTGALNRYPVLPVVINCAAAPRPSFARVRRLGEAVGRYLATLGRRVLVIGSGGLSHDPPTPRLDLASPQVAARLVDRHTPTEEDLRKREARVVAAAHAMVQGGGPCMPPSEAWDREFLNRLMRLDFVALERYTDDELDRVAGFGGHEVRCWVAALAAMHAAQGGGLRAELDYYEVIPEWITGMGIVSASSA
jgi:2,3-dihydroxyphenylpropionate 1,2-dioxygenase